jgi:hypothetical protein
VRHLPAAREAVRRACGEALRLVEEQPTSVDSDAWQGLADRLERAAEQLASVVHCLYEWPEPTDAAARESNLAIAMKRQPWRWENEAA